MCSGQWIKFDREHDTLKRGDLVIAKLFSGAGPRVVDVLRPHRNGMWWVTSSLRSNEEYLIDQESVQSILINDEYNRRRQ